MSRRERRNARKYKYHRTRKKNRTFARVAIVLVFAMLAGVFLARGFQEQTAQREIPAAQTAPDNGTTPETSDKTPDDDITRETTGAEPDDAPAQSAFPENDNPPYTEVNDNIPVFDEADDAKEPFTSYAPLDALGRCGTAYALLSKEMMPAEKTRAPMTEMRPSGWHTVKYPDQIPDLYLYNRCHLIAYALTGEAANEQNLITGTRYLNVSGMLPFEEQVMRYLERTGNHVLYRVTPDFTGEELVARGVEMEAYSVEDNGEGISFHVYIPNIQPGIDIDYATGESSVSEPD